MQNKSYLYVLPNDAEAIVQVVDKIKGCSFVTGFLEAPAALLASHEAIGNTGLILQRFHNTKPTIKTMPPQEDMRDLGQRLSAQEDRQTEGLSAIFSGKQPGFVEYDEAGYDDNPMPYFRVQETIINLIKKGYRGRLNFDYGHVYRQEFWRTEAFLTMRLGGIRGQLASKYPYSIEFQAITNDGEHILKPIAEYCLACFGEPKVVKV